MDNEIAIRMENNEAVVSSREVAEHFGKRHDKLMSEIKRMYGELIGYVQNGGHPLFYENKYIHEQNGQEYTEYLMNRDGFSLLVMGFTGEKALEWKLKYISAFNQMEKSLIDQNQKALPATYKEALIQLLDQVEKNEELEAENKKLEPKAEYHDEVLNKDGLITTTLIAKDLGLKSASTLNTIFFINKILYKNGSGVWVPYSKYAWLTKDGYADYRSYTNKDANLSLQWTEKGRKWIIENFGKWDCPKKNCA